ncbi:MAG: hypothetical protein K2R98_11090 [Gemmataceae bacterium]|nr:hypothetical protein [Gemmataceae bacterium]
MFWQRVRFALLAGVLANVAASARAGECCQPAPCAPAYRTVCCYEWVPEQFQATRTCYKTECRQETYTAYRCECVPETRTRVCTVYKMVPETRVETRTYCVCVPVCEEKTVMQACWSCVPVTKMVKKCVDQGHWECREVCCKPSLCDRIKEACKKHKEGCCYCPPPVKTKTEKCWVPCKVWVECPVTCMEKVCTYKPVTVKCVSYKKELRSEQVNVTCCKCVAEQRTETYTCYTTRQVPVQCTRNVAVCVPVTETVTCTRMVCRKVEKQVACAPTCCETSCCTPCCTKKKCHKFGHKSGCCE